MSQSPFQRVILVDTSDREIGSAEKQDAHENGLLHRAFSVFLLRERGGSYEMLLQKRHENKYHSGGLWSNTCCSHPQPGEDLLRQAQLCLAYELGILGVALSEVGTISYRAEFQNGLTENEIDHIFYGFFDQEIPNIPFNREEATDLRWESLGTVYKEIEVSPDLYTVWLRPSLQCLQQALGNISK
jgi:isopentenyl-diphosphate delta-isomerase type 1